MREEGLRSDGAVAAVSEEFDDTVIAQNLQLLPNLLLDVLIIGMELRQPPLEGVGVRVGERLMMAPVAGI